MTARACLLLVPLLSCGCAALPIAALGSALGLATSAAGAGGELYSSGKLDSVELATLDATRLAVLAAMNETLLHAVEAHLSKDKYVLRLADDKKAKVIFTLDPRTPAMTAVRIDVGLFGSEPAARLFLQRVRHHLGVMEPMNDKQ